ncbi:MAG: RagB/SusD family nutrient uptake outer membrane protein [Rikenellaceae bacterium]
MKMNIIKYLMLIASVATLNSCSDDLEEVIYSQLVTSNAFVSESDASAAIDGIYSPLITVTHRAIFYLNDMTTDACYREQMDCELLNEASMSSNADVTTSWSGYYSMVARANTAIDYIPLIADEEFDDDEDAEAGALEKAAYLAQAYFLRAFAYYQLTDLFYTVPLVTDSQIEVTSVVSQSSITEIEDQIKSDLDIAKLSLPLSYAATTDAGRATYGAALGLLARVHMRAAGRLRQSGGDASSEWTSALKYVNEIMELEGSTYSLQAKVWDIFDPTTDAALYNNEIIFAVRASGDIASGASDVGMNFTPWTYDMGWDLFSIPLETVWKFDQDDERFSVLMVTDFRNVYDANAAQPRYYKIPETIEDVNTVYEVTDEKITYELDAGYTQKYKYLNPGTYNYRTNNNVCILRYADIILCKAEILNELYGPTQEAVDLINRIRERAFGHSSKNLVLSDYSNTDALRRAICDERLLELNNEGVRRPDLIRMGLWKETMEDYIAAIKLKSEWMEANAESATDLSSMWLVYPQDLTENDIRRYFPVPKTESDINPDLLNCRDF